MTTFFVVSHQNYIYGCDCSEETDYERWSEGFTVKGIFKTKNSAKDFIKTDSMTGVNPNDDEERKMAEHEQSHYFLEEMQLRD